MRGTYLETKTTTKNLTLSRIQRHSFKSAYKYDKQ